MAALDGYETTGFSPEIVRQFLFSVNTQFGTQEVKPVIGQLGRLNSDFEKDFKAALPPGAEDS